MGRSYEKLLKKYKLEDCVFKRLVLLDDEMMKIAIAWPHINRMFVKSTNTSTPYDVDFLWSFIIFSYEELSELTMIENPRLKKAFRRLVRLKMIFPDGTISKQVEAYIKTELSKKMGIQIAKKELTDGKK